ncbi:MAG: nuclear transport factor 2 family protein [Anaerolineaceae bacterium]
MSLKGKGFYTWQLSQTEGGNAQNIASVARAAGLTHVLLKIADGTATYKDPKGISTTTEYVQALRSQGIEVWGWHYIYGMDPTGEANKAIQRLRELNLDGYIIDAEKEFDTSGRGPAARTFMNVLRGAFPSLPVALSSYRWPSYHMAFPWTDFLSKCDYNMPQVYWEQAHNAGAQLTRCVNEFQTRITPFRPIIPTGPTYKWNGWSPTEADIKDFLDTAKALNLTAVNFFSWQECRRDLTSLWNLISEYDYGKPPLQDMPIEIIKALNTHDPNQIASLYKENAVHITSARAIQGVPAITSWYTRFFSQILPNATFTLVNNTSVGNIRHFTWRATSSTGNVTNGNDTLGLSNGLIQYHYSYYTITK